MGGGRQREEWKSDEKAETPRQHELIGSLLFLFCGPPLSPKHPPPPKW